MCNWIFTVSIFRKVKRSKPNNAHPCKISKALKPENPALKSQSLDKTAAYLINKQYRCPVILALFLRFFIDPMMSKLMEACCYKVWLYTDLRRTVQQESNNPRDETARTFWRPNKFYLKTLKIILWLTYNALFSYYKITFTVSVSCSIV